MAIVFVGIDLAKNVFAMHAVDEHGKPALVYDLKCPGSQAYLQLAKELIQREKQFTTKNAA